MGIAPTVTAFHANVRGGFLLVRTRAIHKGHALNPTRAVLLRQLHAHNAA